MSDYQRLKANRAKLSTTPKPQHSGRAGDIWPILEDGVEVELRRNTTYDYPSLLSVFYLDDYKKLGKFNSASAARFGNCLMAWLLGCRDEAVFREVTRVLKMVNEEDGIGRTVEVFGDEIVIRIRKPVNAS